MKILSLSLVACFLVSTVNAQDREDLIDDALAPLPPQLQDGAKVVQILDGGDKIVVREGSNGITCRPDMQGGPYLVRCHPSKLEPLFDRIDTLIQTEGLRISEARDLVLTEIEDGSLPRPIPGTVNYLFLGPNRESAKLLSIIFVSSESTPSELGFGTDKDVKRPYLSWEGTALAHVMLHGM